MCRLFHIAMLCLPWYLAEAQLSGTVSVPSTYSTMAALLADLNANGTSGPLTVNISAGYTETVMAGGFTLSASGSSASPILFQKQGAGSNPLFYAYAGNKTPGSALQDGIWRIAGSDYVTIDGIDLLDANTTNPSTMEFGFGLFKINGTNGCQHVTIKNCVVTLKRSNNSSGSGPAADGSRAFEVVNATISAHNSALVVSSSDGAHSFNRFYSNVVQNCNIGFALTGYISTSSYSLCDAGNEIGSLFSVAGNTIVNFGGGGSNGSSGIRAFAQYDLLVGSNCINSDTGPGLPHQGTLRGIHVGAAPTADISVIANTITLHGGGTGSNLSCIENSGGGAGFTNTVTIHNNHLLNCTYRSAVNGSFYGIWNNASSGNLYVTGNVMRNNSSGADGGSTYLLYNNGSVTGNVAIDSNDIAFVHSGPGTYTGTLYGVYNSAAAAGASITINANTFRNFMHEGGAGTGALYFIYNTADVSSLSFSFNKWKDLQMNHSGAEYFIYNSSSTYSALTVSSNTVMNYTRNAAASNLYGYYGAASVAGTATHVISGNLFSTITATIPGTGNFYGIYSAEGNTSPFPLKTIAANTITNVRMAGSGNFYGIYATDLGDAGSLAGSLVENNFVTGCEFGDATYGLYFASATSPVFPARVRNNEVRGLTSYTGTAYGAYLGSNNAGIIFSANKISNVVAQGTVATAYGLYGATTSTSSIINNIIGHIEAPFSGGANRCNGIYISTGTLINIYYNSVKLHASSSGINFGSNALYVSSTASLVLKNNIFVNTSTVTGSGIAAAYRRSSTALTNYNTGSGNNLFYTGSGSSSYPVFYNGSSYTTFSAFQAFVSPRENNSVSQLPFFSSLNPISPNYLHLLTYSASLAESGASSLTTVPTDVDSESRYGNSGYAGGGAAPDIGADEFETNTTPCTTVSPAGISASTLHVCAGQTLALYSSSVTPGSGLQQSWKMSASSGGPYTTTVSSGPEYFSSPLTGGTYYFVLESTCLSNSVFAVSPEVQVTVQTLPLANASVISSFVCAGDTIKLSVAGTSTSTYYWTGPNGFYSSRQSPFIVARDVSAGGNYIVQVTDGSCSSLPGAAATVTVNEVTFTVSLSYSVMCKGDSAALKVSGTPVTYTWSTGSTSSSVIVSPSLSTAFSVAVADSLGCRATGTASVSVVNATLSPRNTTVCGAALQTTVGVLSYSPSLVQWYASASSVSVLATGSTFTTGASSSTTVFADVTPLWPQNLLTPFDGGELSGGVMFDLVSAVDLRIKGIDLHLPSTSIHTVEVWYRWGSFNLASSSSAGWQSAGSCTVFGEGQDQLTTLPLVMDVQVLSTQTIALYVAVSGGSLLCTNTGTFAGEWSSNNDAAISVGNCGSYFNCTTAFRGWNGQLRFERELCKTARVPVELLVAPEPTVTLSPSSYSICPGKSCTLTVSGASSYSWSTGGTNSIAVVHPNSPKTYTVRGTTVYGCVGTDTLVVGMLSVPVVTATSSFSLVCPSEPVELVASGADSYVWNTGANGYTLVVNPPIHTTYTVYGTSTDGCVGSTTISVLTKTVPVIKIQQSADTVCPYNPVVLKASGADSYTWIPGNTLQQTLTVLPAVSSVYNAIGTSVNSCTSVGYVFVFVDPCSSLSSARPGTETVFVYPNPSGQSFYITMPPGEKEIEVITSAGVCTYRYFTNSRSHELILNTPPGLYCLIVRVNHLQEVIRLVKE